MVLVGVLVVAVVLGFAWLSGMVPAVDRAIGLDPVVIVGLVLVTVVVLLRAVRRH